MSDAAWVATLDAIEDHLDRAAALAADPGVVVALDGEAPDVASFTPPADLGPLPKALASRAAELLARLHATSADVAESLAAVRQELGATTRLAAPSSDTGTRSHYLDTSA
jgi:hypothetical protein